MRPHPVSRTVLASVVTATVMCSVAHAEAAEPETGDAATVEPVVVTAQKREQNLQDVPIAITAFTEQRLKQLGATRLTDLSNRAPGVIIEKFVNAETVFIRGVGGGGRSIGFGSRAGIYIDGVYAGQPGAIDQSLTDIQRVEILRGPQGTLFGRNTVSGAINVITRPPSGEFGAQATVRAGNFDQRSLAADVHGPLIPDRLFAKLSISDERRDGFIRNLFDGARQGGQLRNDAIRGSLRWLPSAKLTVDLTADYGHDRSQLSPIESVSSPTGGLFDPLAPEVFEVNENTPRLRSNRNYGVSATATYQLPAGHTLTSITAWRGVRSFRQTDNDYSPLDLMATYYKDVFEQGSQELRVASPSSGRLRYVAGVFLIDEIAHTYRSVVIGADATAARLPVAAGALIPAAARVRTRSYAAFANLDFDIVPQLTLNVGGRYTYEERSVIFNLDGSRSGGFGIATLTNFRDQADENRFTPTIGLTYHLGPDANVYAKYSEGFKSGGWNVDFLNRAQVLPIAGRPGTPFAFATETAHSYEAGVKAELLEHRVRLNLAGFLASYGDYQINQYIQNGATTVIQLANATKVDTSGVEASFEAQVTPNLRLTADASFLRTRFVSFPGGGQNGRDASGNRLPFAPRFTAAVGGDYTLPFEVAGGRISLFYQYNFRGFSYAAQENLIPGQQIPSYGLSTGRLAWRSADRRLELALWGENLGDHRYIVNQGLDFLGTKLVAWGEPRTWGVELKAKM